MKRVLFVFIFITVSAFSNLAQTEKAELSDELGNVNCEVFLSRSDYLFSKLEKDPTSIAYLIFYEGKHLRYRYNEKTQQHESKYVNPKHGEARNKAKAIIFYLTERRRMSNSRFILVDGGYRQNYSVEIWIAPQNAEPPKPSPTLERKDIKFRIGKAPKIGDCTQDF